MFSFYPCDLSFNGKCLNECYKNQCSKRLKFFLGTTPIRGQIPSLLYYSSPVKPESINGRIRTEIHARDTALKVIEIQFRNQNGSLKFIAFPTPDLK